MSITLLLMWCYDGTNTVLLVGLGVILQCCPGTSYHSVKCSMYSFNHYAILVSNIEVLMDNFEYFQLYYSLLFSAQLDRILTD